MPGKEENPFMKLGREDDDNPFMKLGREEPIEDEYDPRVLQDLQESYYGVTPKDMTRGRTPAEWEKSGRIVAKEALGMGGWAAGSAVIKPIGVAIGTAVGGPAGGIIGGGIASVIGGTGGYFLTKSISDSDNVGPGEVVEMGAEMAAMDAGLKIPGNVITKMVGAALGYTGVKTTEDIVKGTTPESLPEAGTDTVKNFAIGFLINAIGLGTGFAIKKIAAPRRGNYVDAVTEAINENTENYLNAAKEVGYNPTAAEIPGKRGTYSWNLLEKVLSNMPFSAGKMQKRRVENLDTLLKTRNEILSKRKGNESDLEDLGYRIKEKASELLKTETEHINNVSKEQIDGLTAKFIADTNITTTASEKDFALSSELKSFFDTTGSSTTLESVGGKTVQDLMAGVKTKKFNDASGLLEEAKIILGNNQVKLTDTTIVADELIKQEMSGKIRNTNLLRILRKFSSEKTTERLKIWFPTERERIVRQAEYDALMGETTQKKVKWEGLDRDRSKLGELIREANDLSGTEYASSKGSMSSAGRSYYLLRKAIMKDMEMSAKSAGKPDAYETFMKGKKDWGEAEQLFDFDVLKIMKKPSEDVFTAIINAGEVTTIRKMKEILGDKAFKPLKEIFTRKIIAIDKNGVFDVVETKKNINKYGEAFNEVFNERERGQIEYLTTQATEIEDRNARGLLFNKILAVDKNGLIDSTTTKKRIAERKNSDELSKLYTQEEREELNVFVDNIKKINVNSVASNKSEAVSLLGKISKKDAAGIVDLLIRPNNTVRMTHFKKLMGEELTQEVETKFISEYLIKINQYGSIYPNKMTNIYNKYQKTLKNMFDKDTSKGIENLMTLAKNSTSIGEIENSQIGSAITARGQFRTLVHSASNLLFLAAGSGAGVGVGYAVGYPITGTVAALAAVFTPDIIARLYLSKIGRKYLTIGYLIPAKSKQAIELFTRMAEISGVKLSGSTPALKAGEDQPQDIANNEDQPQINWKEIGE